MIISHERRFVFVAVPKTGSTAVTFALGEDIGDEVLPQDHHRGIDAAIAADPRCAGYFKFAFVRNPWDRLVSAFHNFTQEEEHFEWSHPLHEYPGFNEFCLEFPQTNWIEWIHFWPQADLLSLDGELAMDFIGRFETLQQDFAHVCEALGLGPIALERVRPSDHAAYRTYYTPETREIVRRCYARDVEAFDYDF